MNLMWEGYPRAGSGGLNPVTVSMVAGRMEVSEAIGYIISPWVGAILGALIILRRNPYIWP
jgi:glycerol uptake facilitator-like aquaporin